MPGQSEPPWDERAVIEELWTIRQHAFQDDGAPRRRVDQTLTPKEQREQLGRFLGASGLWLFVLSSVAIGACIVDDPDGGFYVELQPDSADFEPEALAVSGLGRDLFGAANRWFSRVPGGLGASAIGSWDALPRRRGLVFSSPVSPSCSSR